MSEVAHTLVTPLLEAVGDEGLVAIGAPLGQRTTYRVGGTASVLVTAFSAEAVRRVAQVLASTKVEVLVVGNGSNLLVRDGGFDGVVVHLAGGFEAVVIEGTTVIAGGSAQLPRVARQCVEAGLDGFTWAVGVPGTIGGAVVMNAGGHGASMHESLAGVEVVDLGSGETSVRSVADLELSYRHSNLGPTEIVLGARLELSAGSVEQGRAALSEIVAWRRAHQPGGQNAGSVFQNPAGTSAGTLIEAAGLKGHRLGTAMVSQKHANFIQADPGGRAEDVEALLELVRDEVARHSGITLSTELRIVGDPR